MNTEHSQQGKLYLRQKSFQVSFHENSIINFSTQFNFVILIFDTACDRHDTDGAIMLDSDRNWHKVWCR